VSILTWHDQWSPLYRSRWNWADLVIDEYVRDLDKSLQSHFHRGDDPSPDHFGAVMYGKTQAGKTTLILKLMGLSEDGVAKSVRGDPTATQILRAGRIKGNSSTAIPTRYSWSRHPDRWEYSFDGESTELSGREVFARLQKFRDEEGDPSSLDDRGVLDLGIPYRYRSQSSPTVVPMILDLPGVEAESQQEREYAARLVRRYVPAAQMVVLMSTADSVASLFSGLVRELPQLSVWDTVPERFRIVLTRTVSSSSVRGKFAQADLTATTGWLREHAYTELALSHRAARLAEEPSIKERIKSVLFPVEFGESWENLREKHPELHCSFAPVVDELLADLAGEVGQTAVEDSRRISMSHAATTVRIAAERHQMELKESLASAKRQASDRIDLLERSKEFRRRAEKRRETAQKLHKSLRYAKKCDLSLERGDRSTNTDSGHAVREAGRENQQKVVERTEQKWKEWLDSEQVRYVVRKIGYQYRPPDQPVDAGAIFMELWDCCGHCSSDIWPWNPDPDHCQWKQGEAWEPALSKISSDLNKARRRWISMARRQVRGQDLTRTLTSRLNDKADLLVQKYEQQAEHAKHQVLKAKNELEGYHQVVEEATRRSEQLANMLDAGCASEMKKHLSQADIVDGADDRLAHVLGALLARHQRQQLRLEAR
jgi:hypothetical protein